MNQTEPQTISYLLQSRLTNEIKYLKYLIQECSIASVDTK